MKVSCIALWLMSGSSAAYRDRIFIYIIKDLILKFVEWGELNQTSLMSFCRPNLKKHRSILDGMEANGLIARRDEADGEKVTTIYKSSPQKDSIFLRNN